MELRSIIYYYLEPKTRVQQQRFLLYSIRSLYQQGAPVLLQLSYLTTHGENVGEKKGKGYTSWVLPNYQIRDIAATRRIKKLEMCWAIRTNQLRLDRRRRSRG